MRHKIQPGSGSLCVRCQHSQVMERATGAVTIMCHETYPEIRVPLDIVRCSEFLETRHVSKHDFEQIAWTIRHDRSGRIVGFQPPRPKKDKE